MFGIGFWEMLLIGGLVLVAVGPDRLPGMIKTVARYYRQARRAAQDIRQSTGIDDLMRDEELKELAQLRNQKIQLAAGGKPVAPLQKSALVPKPMASAAGKPEAGAEIPGKPAAPEGTLPAGKPGALDKPLAAMGKPLVPSGGAMELAAPLRGLSLEERRRELPPDGVDVELARARRARPAASEVAA